MNILCTKKGNIRKYTTLCGGINEDGERKSKKNNEIYLLNKYIKSVLWGSSGTSVLYTGCMVPIRGVAVGLSYI